MTGQKYKLTQVQPENTIQRIQNKTGNKPRKSLVLQQCADFKCGL